MADPPPPKRCCLLEIPTELRLKIYEDYITDCSMRDMTEYALLHTCKIIHHEALPLFLAEAKRVSRALQTTEAELEAQLRQQKLDAAIMRHQLALRKLGGLVAAAHSLASSPAVDAATNETAAESR